MDQGPIVIIEDDQDDREIYAECLQAIGIKNDIHFFPNADKALEYLTQSDELPFVLISDVNMPGMSGFDLKRTMNQDPFLASKGIPFIFISTNSSKVYVQRAHMLSAQGYFQKPQNIAEIQAMLRKIFDYWELCRHINNTL